MKISRLFFPIILFAATVSGTLAAAPSLGNITLHSGSTLSLSGDSTLHPFTSSAKDLRVTGMLDPQALGTRSTPMQGLDAILQHAAMKKLDVVIPVRSLTSKESGLDKNMYKALKADQCPEILFHMNSYQILNNATDRKASNAKVNGILTIACQEKSVILDAVLTPGTEGLRAQGGYTLLMTDYGVKPPSLMLGAIKVKDPVVINFDLQLGF